VAFFCSAGFQPAPPFVALRSPAYLCAKTKIAAKMAALQNDGKLRPAITNAAGSHFSARLSVLRDSALFFAWKCATDQTVTDDCKPATRDTFSDILRTCLAFSVPQ
jgi:hypothetical protein